MNRSSIFKNSICAALLAVVSLSLVGCQTGRVEAEEVQPPPPTPIKVIRVGAFECDNAVIAKAVRNVFIETLLKYDARIIKEGDADVVIEGTVTLSHGGSSSDRGRVSAGEYVSGVTSTATRSGEIITSASWGQSLEKGSELLPPEIVAREAADNLADALTDKGLKERD